MERINLPDFIKKVLKEKFYDERLLLAISSDLNNKGIYKREWFILTEKRIFVFNDNKKLWDIKIADIKKISIQPLVGSGAVGVIKRDGKTVKIILFSNSKTPEFNQLVESVNKYLDKKEFNIGLFQKYYKVCNKCNNTISYNIDRCIECSTSQKTFFRILKYLKSQKTWIKYLIITTVLTTCFGLITPYMGKVYVDYILNKNLETNTFDYANYIHIAAFIMLFAYLGQMAFEGLHEYLSGCIGYRIIYQIRDKVYKKLQHQSLSYFDKHQTGAVLTRVNQDTSELQKLLINFFPLSFQSAFILFGIGILLFCLSWKLTLVIFVPIFGVIFFLKFIFFGIWNYFHSYFHKRSRLNALVSDAISGMRVIKAFGQEKLEIEKFDKRSADYRDAGILLIKKWSIYHPVLHIFIMVGLVLVWWLGGQLVIKGEMKVGDIIAYQGYLMMFYRPIFILTKMSQIITNSLSAAERVFEVIDSEIEVKESKNPVEMNEAKGKIQFQNVTFGYDKFKPVVKKMNFTIKEEEMVGLVGKSGAGKSTIINIITRLYDVNEGKILIDNVDIRDIKYSDLKKQFGIVLQDTFLFNGTIFDNVIYSKPEASKKEVIQACIEANAHAFIINKPDGYDTEVGERGNNLSGGEKQRIAIARAILKSPRILILDEATSAVDTQTEIKIHNALEKLTRGRTTIAIAHRLSTLKNCDRLFVIENGEIMEIGTHKELMEKKGRFYDLVKMQKELSKIKAVDG